MASHYIAIAKASFAAALLRPDPTSVGRDEIGLFHNLLDEAINKCTPSNIQKCKVWLSTNVVNSAARTTAFGKYISALSTSLGKPAAPTSSQRPDAALPVTPAAEKSALKKKRLHLLYLLNDVLHHAKYHTSSTAAFPCFTSHMQPQMISLFNLAASFDRVKHSKHHTKLEELLQLWQEQAYYARDIISKLQETVKNTGESETNGAETVQSSQAGDSSIETRVPASKEQAFIVPAIHGDLAIPYHDLPAGNMIPHVISNSIRPINAQLVKPAQFVGGPAKESLVGAVKGLLKEAEFMYGVYDEGIVADIDEMGQPMMKEGKNGELLVFDSYYGWSIEFCERMKKRKEAGDEVSNGNARRGRSASRSDDGSASPYKRRRYSSSGSRRDRSRSRSAKGFRSYNRSRSRSPRNEYANGSGHSESQSNPRLRSSPTRHRQRSYSPPSAPRPSFLPQQLSHLAPYQNFNAPLHTPTAQIDNPIPSQAPGAPVPLPPSTYNHNFPIGPGGLPIPPPPPFHTGPWPPPPPSMPAGMSFNPAPFPGFSTVGFVPPPPAPPSHTPYGGGSMHGHGQWLGQGRGGVGQGQWEGGQSGRGGYGNWDGRDVGRDGGGRGGWDHGNTSRGGGSQEQWNRGHTGRGGGNWRGNQDSRRRR